MLSVQMVFFLKVTDMMVEEGRGKIPYGGVIPVTLTSIFFKKRPYSPYVHLQSSVPPTFQLFKKGLLNASFLNQKQKEFIL